MSNIWVLRKLLKFHSINQLVKSNARQIGNNRSPRLQNIKQSTNTKCITSNTIVLLNSIDNDNLNFGAKNQRLVHTYSSLCSDKDENTKNLSVDQFRAEQEKIEREYEQQQQLEQEKQKNQNHSTDKCDEDSEKIQEIRSRILDASLAYVKVHGWSRESISHGAESINFSGVVHGMFPNGAIELIHHFYTKSNRALIEQLKDELDKPDKSVDSNGLAVAPNPKDFAIKAIRMRLEMIIPYKEQWPQALAIMTMPQNVQISLAQLLTLVDDICYCAGDQSVDIGWYTRRIGIATIYKMVELYMIQDKSPDHRDTWEFLHRRMDEGIQIQEFLITSDQKTRIVTKALGSAFQTARNILGINCDKR